MPTINNDQLAAAAGGMQQPLRITGATGITAAQLDTVIGRTLKDVGALPAGTYYCDTDITGLRKLEVRIRATNIGTSITPSVFSTLLDAVTSRKVSTPAGVAMVANAEQVLAFADGDLLGERILRIQFVVVGVGATFDRAEIAGI
jgi:hypothetical protein